MKSWFVDLWIQIRASYWFVPSIMVISAVAIALVAVQIDVRAGGSWLADIDWLHGNRPAGAQALLSTVAGSMITVAGVTFSMTLLAVSHASSQIGPRLLTGFMRDQGNQITLGTFIATFIYCIVVLRTVHAGEANGGAASFVPHIAILIALGFAVVNVFVLIYFIHHVPQSINVSNVIARVGDELVNGVLHMYPKRVGQPFETTDRLSEPKQYHGTKQTLPILDQTGYLRVLDADGLLKSATENDWVIEVFKRPGDFAVPGQPLMQVWTTEALDEEVTSILYGAFSWGVTRSHEQDLMFPADQLIEVLGRAMSPGINGQHTAILCLNQIERTLVTLLSRDVPDARRYDADDALRVIANPITHAEFMELVFRPIRQFIRGDWIVSNQLMKMLVRLASMEETRSEHVLLETEIELLSNDVQASTMPDIEKSLIQSVLHRLVEFAPRKGH